METLFLGKGAVVNMAIGVLIVVIMLFLYLFTKDYRRGLSSQGANGSIAGTGINWQDRRGTSRVEVKWPVTVETAEGPLNGEIVNVSMGGAFICCQKIPRLKEKFRLTINPPDHQAVIVIAEVVWSNFNVPESEVVNRGMGVRFAEISDEGRQFIFEAVADHHRKRQDRRETLRVEAKWPVTIETDVGSFNGEIMNFGIGGAFVCCQKLPHLRGTFRLTINPPDHQAVIVTAEVVWSNFNVPESAIVNRGMGVRFAEISDEDRQFISEAVAEHH